MIKLPLSLTKAHMRASILMLRALILAALTGLCALSGNATAEEDTGLCGQCTTVFECAEGLRCVSTRCRTNDQCCFDADCPGGQRCLDNRCQLAVQGAALCGRCNTSFECANDLNCIGARCKEVDQCCLDQDCPTGQSCQNNRCQ